MGYLCHCIDIRVTDYVNAGNRSDILEEIGCYAAQHNSIVFNTTFVVSALILALISAVYGGKNFILCSSAGFKDSTYPTSIQSGM